MDFNPWTVGRRATAQDTDTRIEDLISDRQLIVVSNRQPYRHEADGDEISVDRPAGGLTAGLDPIMQETGGTWVAWGDGDKDHEVVDSDDCVSVPPDDPGYRLKRIWLSDEQVTDYYYGYSNQVLWPLCHSALTRMRGDADYWSQYRDVNELFAEAVIDLAEEDPLVWFQDYHLSLAPDIVRRHLSTDATLMHFWHIPWPSWDVFRSVPHRREIIEGLLGNDLLGFHVPRFRTNFLRSVDAAIDGATIDWENGVVSYRGQHTTVAAIPMGVPFESIRQAADTTHATEFWSTFRESHDIPTGTQVGIGVDRLDYTKGLEERLKALEHLWENYSEYRESFTYIQIGSESRSRISDYKAVQEQVAQMVERINDRFGTEEWDPIVYVTEHLSNEDLYGLYRRADAAIVTPIRDGMNLVAQEYVAAQVDGHGALLLSDQAGVHDAVGEYAVTITPTDTAGFAQSIDEVLSMSPVERRRRMRRLRRWVADHDLETWLRENFSTMAAISKTDSPSLSTI